MNAFTVRPAVPSDARSLAKVHVQSWQTAYRGIVPDTYLAGLPCEIPGRELRWLEMFTRSPREFAFVAEDTSEGVVGFVRGGRSRPPHFGADGEISALYLLAEHRRRRLGRALVGAIAPALRDAGYRAVVVWVLSENPARRFYELLGGERRGTKWATIGGRELEETAFVWSDVGMLLPGSAT